MRLLLDKLIERTFEFDPDATLGGVPGSDPRRRVWTTCIQRAAERNVPCDVAFMRGAIGRVEAAIAEKQGEQAFGGVDEVDGVPV
jgi:hypothetical protein